MIRIEQPGPSLPSPKNLIILGAGGFAREAACWVHPQNYMIVGFFTEHEQGPTEIFDTQVVRSLDHLPFNTHFLVAVGDPSTRKRLWELAISKGLQPCLPIIGPHVVIGREVKVGFGCIICPGNILTCNIWIDDSVIVNLNCTIGHDCYLESFVTLSPGVNLSGNVRVGQGSFVGTNAAIREKVTMGIGSTLGMGAVLTKDQRAGEIWVGNPARPLVID